jgi:hypothetical protein
LLATVSLAASSALVYCDLGPTFNFVVDSLKAKVIEVVKTKAALSAFP